MVQQVNEVAADNKEQFEMNQHLSSARQPRQMQLKDSGLNTSSKVRKLGQVNLAFDEDVEENEMSGTQKMPSINEDNASLGSCDLSLLSKVPNTERKYSVRQECKFVKARRLHLKELRRYLGLDDDGTGRNVLVIEEKIRVEIFLKLFNTMDVLDKLFRLFDYHQEGKLNQDNWIEGLKSGLNKIRDDDLHGSEDLHSERRVDFVEVVESVAYAVCGSLDVTFEQFCRIFKTKNVLNKFFSLIDQDYDGVVTAEEIMAFISQLSGARNGSRLTKENIAYLENLFRQYVGEDKEIKKEDFSKILQTKNQFFTDRVFDIFDGDASGSISLQEFLDATRKFAGENPADKILFLFKVYDVDGDGLIQEAELEQVMRACMEENGMKFTDGQIHELTKALFEDADVEGRGALTYDALKAQLEKHGGLLENLSISIERWLVPPKPKKKEKEFSTCKKLREMKPHQMSRRYIRNNYVYLLWLMGFLAANLALFITRSIVFRRNHPSASEYLVIARAAGQCLNFDCIFIVIVMLRQSLTFLRSHGASSYIPIDQHIYFHKLTGNFIFFFSLLHTVMHLVNLETGFVQSPTNIENLTYFDYLFNPKASSTFGLIPGCAFYTGIILMLILIIMVVCSFPFVRRGGSFEVFYWTHLLYVPFFILLIFHAPTFWAWFLIPGIMFVIEQAFRIIYWRIGKGKSYITSGILLPSKVTHLIIKKPANFDFHPGDYVFVRIPKIAKYEWHPFTISSCPEQEDVLWLHIRAVGEWTNRLYTYFEQEQSKLSHIPQDDKKDLFFKMPIVNRKIATKRRVEAIYNGGNNNIRRSITPLVVIDETTKRKQLQSVADSNTSVTPESEHSTVPSENSLNNVSTSGELDDSHNERNLVANDTSQDSNAMDSPFGRKIPVFSTKSMPDVNERMSDRERKLHFREVLRSESVAGDQISYLQQNSNIVQDPFKNRRRQTISNASPASSALSSSRYMRNKPKIISLKAPKSMEDYEVKEELLGGRRSSKQRRSSSYASARLAEEGRMKPPKVSVTFSNNGDLRKNSGFSTSSFSIDETETDANENGNNDEILSAEIEYTGQALEIYVDGSYGAPSSHIFRAQHAVLIGTGIGVTPFASILQSIMRRYWASRNTCPNCTYTWCSDLPQSVLNLRKVDFFWINRDQRSFEWFVQLLSLLEIEQAELGGAMERFLDMHMYITSALQRTDMKAVGLQLALDLLHEKDKRDMITGLKTRTNAGRPNWNKIFQQLKDQQKGKVTVFYCGPPELARTLKLKCDEFDFSFRKELF